MTCRAATDSPADAVRPVPMPYRTTSSTAARAWRDDDPDAATRAELDAVLEAAEVGRRRGRRRAGRPVRRHARVRHRRACGAPSAPGPTG